MVRYWKITTINVKETRHFVLVVRTVHAKVSACVRYISWCDGERVSVWQGERRVVRTMGNQYHAASRPCLQHLLHGLLFHSSTPRAVTY